MDATSSSCRSLLPATMPIGEFLLTLPQSAVVCEIGGGSSRKSRADWVIDIWTYDQATLQPGDRVSADRWIVHNVCTPGPWPVPDNAFDFTICSHLLEDIHDPFHVLSELMRVSPRGYVETPSRAWESARNPYGR